MAKDAITCAPCYLKVRHDGRVPRGSVASDSEHDNGSEHARHRRLNFARTASLKHIKEVRGHDAVCTRWVLASKKMKSSSDARR